MIMAMTMKLMMIMITGIGHVRYNKEDTTKLEVSPESLGILLEYTCVSQI